MGLLAWVTQDHQMQDVQRSQHTALKTHATKVTGIIMEKELGQSETTESERFCDECESFQSSPS